jgi:hypothetical protein
MTRRKEFLLAVTTVTISVVTFLSLAEIILRFLPVASSRLVVPVTSENPVYHYTPNDRFIFSRDWDLSMVNYGRVNNDGWVNDQDYKKGDPVPLLGVIGDSFIEAAMVPYAETVQGRLAKSLLGGLRVYSFAAAGAALSQYLIWARYAVREYGAEALIINVVGNDFDESHIAYQAYPGFWIYVPDANNQLRLQLVEFHVGRIRSLLKHSALARYLLLDMHAKETLARWDWLRPLVLGQQNVPSYAGNTSAKTDAARMNISMAVIDAFFRDLPAMTGLPTDRITFTLDGFRYPDAAKEGNGTYFDRMRRAFREAAEARGYEVIDLDPLFFLYFRQHGSPFEYAGDHHWNSAAHAIVADAILSSRLLARLQPGLIGSGKPNDN